MDLNNIQWGEFEIRNEFFVKNSKAYHKTELEEAKNIGISYVSRTNLNNGVESIVKIGDFKFNKENTIVFGAENATFFYQPNKYITGNKMYYIEKENLNQYSGLFIQMMLNNSIVGCGFGYGKGLIGSRVEKRCILLPINSIGQPDYAFMEQYMRYKEQEKIDKFQKYIAKRIEQTKDFKEVKPLNEKDWAEFNLKEVFPKIQRGRRLKKDDHTKGDMPYASSSVFNNGIDGFIGNKDNVRIFNNCVTLANSGSVGSTFYQPFSFVASDHVTILENKQFNEFIYLFISTIARRLNEKYSFNREINDKRIQREKVVLPINKEAKPDYDYMENYIMKLEYEKLTKYLAIKNKQ